MRRNKGMTLVEVLIAILITVIIGGSSVLFLRSGLDMERAGTISAENQESLRPPVLGLAPLVERASALEILPALPNRDSLKPGEIVAYVADSQNSTKLNSSQKNMYLRSRSGDVLIPGFSHIKSVRFEKASLPSSGGSPSSGDQAVRLTLTAGNSGKELVYSTDVRSLNRAPVEGLISGDFLKIEGEYAFYDPYITEAELSGGKVVSKDISNKASIPVGTKVVGYFAIFAGDPAAEVEYEWRIYSKDVDIYRMQNFSVVGGPKSGPSGDFSAAKFPNLKKHYEEAQRFTHLDLSLTPPTGTTAHATPPLLLELEAAMEGKHIALAVRRRGSEQWFQSKSYLIATGQNSGFWRDLLDELRKDQGKVVDKDPKTGKETKFENEFVIPGKKFDMQFGNVDPTTHEPHLRLSGDGDTGRGFLAKELDEKYFKKKADNTRDPEFCLENYTMWVDAIVETPKGSSSTSNAQPSKGWGVFLNGNLKKVRPASDQAPTDHFHYGYLFQFDPGVEYMSFPYDQVEEYVPYFYNKSLGKTFKALDNIEAARNERAIRAQGVVIRRVDGDQHHGGVAYGIEKVHRWKEKNDATKRDFGLLDRWEDFWKRQMRYYLWRDIAYKGAGKVYDPVDKRNYQNSFSYVVASDDIHSMRDQRVMVEINLITQTSRKAGGSGTVPDRIFFRVRIYDKPRKYFPATKQWAFPEDTGRSKEMWFGIERGKGLNWGLPYNASYNHVTGNGFVQGDMIYEPDALPNGKIINMVKKQYFGDAIGRFFGLRIWADNKFDSKIYFIDIAKGLPLDFRLPWGTKVGDIMKPLNQGGNWDQDKPYELSNFQ